MALEGTHIQIATEFIDDLNIRKIDQYISGTIYPDTRYPTGIDRELTHPKEYPITDDLDDFTKGWYIHLLCDQVQFDIFNERFSDILGERDHPLWWHQRTALKIIQDIEVFREFDYQKYLSALHYIRNPFDESLDIIKSYNMTMYTIYNGKAEIGLPEIKEVWQALGVDDERLEKVIQITHEFMAIPGMEQKTIDVYHEMVQEMKKRLN